MNNCSVCNKPISRKAKKCFRCIGKDRSIAMKEKHRDGKYTHAYDAMHKTNTGKFGKDATNWKGGRPTCVDCGDKLKDYRSKRCPSCNSTFVQTRLWKQEDYRNKQVQKRKEYVPTEITKEKSRKAMLDWFSKPENRDKWAEAFHRACNVKPNKPETLLDILLTKLFPHEYKYVGDGSFIVGWFNPDFVNVNGQKKIIEMFGDYWHNREDAKKRDKMRFGAYKLHGYSSLVVWEKELKDLESLTKKLTEFHLS